MSHWQSGTTGDHMPFEQQHVESRVHITIPMSLSARVLSILLFFRWKRWKAAFVESVRRQSELVDSVCKRNSGYYETGVSFPGCSCTPKFGINLARARVPACPTKQSGPVGPNYAGCQESSQTIATTVYMQLGQIGAVKRRHRLVASGLRVPLAQVLVSIRNENDQVGNMNGFMIWIESNSSVWNGTGNFMCYREPQRVCCMP